jgi:hypothetical protein
VSRSTSVAPDSFTSFGELLRFLRRRARLTQRELSIAVGYSEPQISYLESTRRLPDAATVAARNGAGSGRRTGAGAAPGGAAAAAHSPGRGECGPRLLNVLKCSANLPAQPTALVGRSLELEEIAGLLANPACRLLT